MLNVVVSGCSYGLGLDITNKLIDEGNFVYGLSRSKPPQRNNFKWLKCDITDKENVKAVFKDISSNIDVLINNAGVFEYGEFSQQTTETIDKIIDVNVKGAMYVTKEAEKHMMPGSHIFFINSVSGLYEIKNESIYSASKHALSAFAGILGEELRDRQIKVTSIHPGGMDTPMQDTNPIKKELLDPREVSSLIVHILKSKAIYKTVKLFPESEWHQ